MVGTFLRHSVYVKKKKLEKWANAQRDSTLPNIGDALCSTPQSLADTQYWSAVQ